MPLQPGKHVLRQSLFQSFRQLRIEPEYLDLEGGGTLLDVEPETEARGVDVVGIVADAADRGFLDAADRHLAVLESFDRADLADRPVNGQKHMLAVMIGIARFSPAAERAARPHMLSGVDQEAERGTDLLARQYLAGIPGRRHRGRALSEKSHPENRCRACPHAHLP